jgi:DNA-binding NarL/FixJ family response regulator
MASTPLSRYTGFMGPELRILLADDHDLIRLEMRELLEEAGLTVEAEARDGREAIALAARLRPHVAVLDLSMPGLGGLELVRRFREASPGTEILICTMHDGAELARELIAAGASGCIIKSEAPSQIIPAVRAVASRQPYFDRRATTD